MSTKTERLNLRCSEQAVALLREAAELLNISVPTLRRMVWAGEISYIDINKGGRHIMARFTESHIEEFLKEREVQVG